MTVQNSLSRLSFVVGILLILTGILVPSSALIEYLGVTPVEITSQLLVGATLFRIGLGFLGLTMMVLGNMPIWKSTTASEKPRSDPHRQQVLAILAAMLLAALALRLYGLSSGLWLDEILTSVLFVKMPFGSIVTTFASENQHFLYSLLARVSFEVFGESAWALRLPAVLFGVGSVWALYLLGREVASAREALLSAALLAFSYTHIWFSQNARGYSGLLFWSILASWLFLKALRDARTQFWLLYAIAAALGVYTHMTMLFVIVAHFFIYLWGLAHPHGAPRVNRWVGLFLGFGLAGLLTFQLYALVLPQVANGMGREESVVAAWKNPLWTILEIARGVQLSFAGGVAAIAALVVFGAGIWSYARTTPAVIQILVIPPVIGASLVIGLGHHLWPRFFFFAMGFGALVVIRGAIVLGDLATRLFKLPPTKSALLGTALCAGLILVSARSIPYAYGPKQDYLGAADFVEIGKEPGDAIVVAGLAAFPYKSYYEKDWEEVETLEALNSIRSRAKRTWLIYTFPPVLEAVTPEIMEAIKTEFRVIKQFDGTVGGGAIFVSRSDSPASERGSKQ